MASSLEIFRMIAPEFSTRDDSEIENYINLASDIVTNSMLTEKQRNKLIAYLAAHIATIALKKEGASGSVSSLSEGSLSMSYANFNAADSYDTTTYGREYKMLSKIFLRYIPTTICV